MILTMDSEKNIMLQIVGNRIGEQILIVINQISKLIIEKLLSNLGELFTITVQQNNNKLIL